jgi:hypothetical protein
LHELRVDCNSSREINSVSSGADRDRVPVHSLEVQWYRIPREPSALHQPRVHAAVVAERRRRWEAGVCVCATRVKHEKAIRRVVITVKAPQDASSPRNASARYAAHGLNHDKRSIN